MFTLFTRRLNLLIATAIILYSAQCNAAMKRSFDNVSMDVEETTSQEPNKTNNSSSNTQQCIIDTYKEIYDFASGKICAYGHCTYYLVYCQCCLAEIDTIEFTHDREKEYYKELFNALQKTLAQKLQNLDK